MIEVACAVEAVHLIDHVAQDLDLIVGGLKALGVVGDEVGADRRAAAGVQIVTPERLIATPFEASRPVLLVPAAAVDRSGMRMGWGRGYFDKTLGSMDRRPPVFAVVFDDELLDALPSEPHDERVDGVVTPSGVVRFS